MPAKKPCPCGSGELFDQCCGPFLVGSTDPVNPEQLMRSRYTANVEQNQAYLLKTWHSATRPGTLGGFSHWRGLHIIQVQSGGDGDEQEGMVEFRAMYEKDGRPGCLHEKSRFVREAGRWYYFDGEIIESGLLPQAKVGRNAPCPCGSGRKYKKCCLNREE
ncbi:MAG TPA: zinc chelation protein SecC [Desulfobulbus sp.]|nr:zinc chelation protein SecC [Desulfobulbus sp.]